MGGLGAVGRLKNGVANFGDVKRLLECGRRK